MNLSTGCNYCKNLDCTDNPKSLLCNFVCLANAGRAIKNAGVCFVEISGGKPEVVQNCPDFVERGRGIALGSVFS